MTETIAWFAIFGFMIGLVIGAGLGVYFVKKGV